MLENKLQEKNTENFTEKLKNCPFCGGFANEWIDNSGQFDEKRHGCQNCLLIADSDIDTWNSRPIEDALRAELAVAKEVTRWIPVEEKLPTSKDPVLGCAYNFRVDKAFYDAETEHWYWDVFFTTSPTIIKWMPLPKPYPEEEAK